MTLRVYNTLTKKKEEFKPIVEGKVNMYVCGVTVYDVCHIGHARANIVFDVIYRYLQTLGYDVNFVRNFTDVDDKIIKKANEEKKECKEITDRYIDEFNTDMGLLNLKKPTMEPKATEHITEMIDMVQKLIDNGHAYAVEGDVYFSVDSFKEYGKLSSRNMDELLAGARIQIDERKRNPLDFALWKASKPNEPKWEAPWGEGRPGWHIECSAMSRKYLGDTFDIHGGGKDLIFPHHENEIAQSECSTGKKFVNYWLHNGFVNINSEKMSKSLKNFSTIKKVLEEYNPEVLRMFLISNHYRSPIDFTDDNMRETKGNLDRCYALKRALHENLSAKVTDEKGVDYKAALDLEEKITGFKESIRAAMNDDFNTAVAISLLLELVRLTNRFLSDEHFVLNNDSKPALEAVMELLNHFSEISGILTYDADSYFDEAKSDALTKLSLSEDKIVKLIDERTEARKNRDFARSDEIRDELLEKGIVLEDSKDGTTWRGV
ncbi:cysteine--tRNA ligase [Thermodesulfobacteriota bacterium]